MLINQRALLLYCVCYIVAAAVVVVEVYGNLLPEAGDGIEVALSVPHLTLALGQAIQFIHVAIGR